MSYNNSEEKDESNKFPPVLCIRFFLCCLSSWYSKHTDMAEPEAANII